MILGSAYYLAFVLVALLLYRLLPTRTLKYGWLTLASWGFYAAASPGYLWVIVLLTIIDYVAARRIAACETETGRKRWLVLSIVSNLGLLAAFKYSGFATDSALAGLRCLGVTFEDRTWDLLLPLGISFHTFQGISYTVDVYRRQIPPVRSFLDYALFVAFFPQLAAGPIVRAAEFLPQMASPPTPSGEQLQDGLRLVALGFFKKLFIADQLHALFVGPAFAEPQLYGFAELRWAAIAWTVQIYCDFSGYTDIALGTAKWFGFELPANFRLPFLATSIADFWRRWHLSLSTWLRDYLYFPLGGSRGSAIRASFNLLLVFILCGLWHGAAWHWFWYGVYNGVLMNLHRVFDKAFAGAVWRRHWLWIAAAWLATTYQLVVGLVFIRLETWAGAGRIWSALFGATFTGDGGHGVPLAVYPLLLLGVLGHAAALVPRSGLVDRLASWSRGWVEAALLIALVVLSPGTVKSFLYIAF